MTHPSFPEIGEIFRGRYRIISVVGAGGFSRVYHAEQVDLGRPVAIKVLTPLSSSEQSEDERQRKYDSVARRFEREAKLISNLRDPHTVVMHDYGRTGDGLFFMVLEYVDGQTIGELIETEGALSPKRVVKIIKQALSSLHEAHTLGVLHRDIKPGNIMVFEHVGRADNVKVLDFGIAKTIDEASKSNDTSNSELTAEGILVGTPRYMSPEQIRGTDLGPPTDIYSLGLVAYEMLMGVKAVPAESSIKIISRHLDTDPIELPPVPNCPRALRSTINRMLAKSVDERFASCRDVLAQLDDWNAERSFDWEVAGDDFDVVDISFVDDSEPPRRGSAVWAVVAIVGLLTTAAIAIALTSERAVVPSEEAVVATDPVPVPDETEIAVNVVEDPEPEPDVVDENDTIETAPEGTQTNNAKPIEEVVKPVAESKPPTTSKRKKRRTGKKKSETTKKTETKPEEKPAKKPVKEPETVHLVPLGGT